MFEKEAEEIAKDIYIHHFDDNVIYPNVLKAVTVGVQKGAEFGYNKGKNEAIEIITALLNVFVYDLADDEMDSGNIDVKEKAEQFLKELDKNEEKRS